MFREGLFYLKDLCKQGLDLLVGRAGMLKNGTITNLRPKRIN